MRIQHNIAALNSHRNLMNNNNAVAKNLEKLSSGYRINRAGDDAAGLAISEKMRAQITGLETAQKNAQDGISLVQTAEGALTEVHSMLNRMVELATQSANGTYDDKIDRDNLQKEMDALVDEIDRISKATNFNGINLLDGTMKNPGDTAVDPDNPAVKVTGPTSGGAVTTDTAAAGGAAGVYSFDLAGIKFDSAGTVTATVAGKTYDVDVTADMSADDFAAKLVAAINKDKPTDTTTGDFTATVDAGTASKIVLTATNSGEFADANVGTAMTTAVKIEPKATEAATGVQAAAAAGTPAYTKGTTFEYDFSALTDTDKPTDSQTIELAGQTFTAVTTSTGADGEFVIGSDIATTLSNLAEAIGKHADLKDKFTAEATDGKLVLTATKDAAAGDTEPGVPTGTWTAGAAVAAPDVTKPEAEGEAGKTGELTLQIGDTAKDYNKITLKVGDMGAEALGLKTGEDVLSIKTQGDAANAIDTIKKAINTVSSTRGDLGAIQNRLEHTINNLSVTTENMTAAESRIRDVDMAKEMMAYTKNNILVQASQAMLAQANQLPQGVLQLLQ